MRVRCVAAVAVVIALVPLAGCAQDSGSAGPAVTLQESRFDPSQLGISRGETVTWRNSDAFEHTVTIRGPSGGTVADEEVPAGETTAVRFDQEGTYEVWCRYHGSVGSGMHMTVDVAR